MAIAVTTQKLVDGPRRVVMQFTGIMDASGVQETNVKKVDVTALSPPAGIHLKIIATKYDVFGPGVLILSWDATVPVPFLVFGSAADHVDYREFGGLWNNAAGGATGSILFSTQGMQSGSVYNVTLDMIKGVVL